jgi:hypothetical protein
MCKSNQMPVVARPHPADQETQSGPRSIDGWDEVNRTIAEATISRMKGVQQISGGFKHAADFR